ncbi:MAG: putative metal-binding motif-containing protein [Saprospiraceae bacterium]|nr:putative metal-binding motif-containing protein [Saprospiraceae bacterium]
MIKPGATEICNGLDDDCDGGVDEGAKTHIMPTLIMMDMETPLRPQWHVHHRRICCRQYRLQR